jgi:hypothetical protein
MTIGILTGVFFYANLLTEVFKTVINILAIALDILVVALVSPRGDVEWITKQKSTGSILRMAHLNL